MSAMYWLVIFIICIIVEAMTISLTTIWFAGGSLVAMFVNLCGGSLMLQVITFLLISLLLLVFTRPIARKHLNAKTTPTNINAIIGKHVVVTEAIDGLQGTGTVQVGGIIWSARAFDGEKNVIRKGEVVEVVAVEGVKLLVKKIEGKRAKKGGCDRE